MATLTPDPNAGSNLVSGGALENTVASQQIVTDLTTPPIAPLDTSTASRPPDQTASADNAAVSNNMAAPETASSSTTKPTSTNRYNAAQENPFDRYIDVTYGISLAMVNSNSISKVSSNPVTQELDGSSDVPGMSSGDYIVFASTAEIKTDKDRPEYYNIQGMNFTNFVGHMPQNPMISTIWDAKLRLFEPCGFSLREDIEMMRRALAYDNKLEPLNYVYRLEIWFSGWDPQTGAWVDQIPFPLNDSANLTSIVYYVSITTIDAVVTTQGTQYQLMMQIFSHKTFRAESLIFRQDTLAIGQTGSQTAQTTAAQSSTIKYDKGTIFQNFITQLTERLAQQVQQDTKSGNFPGLNITYHVTGPTWLMTQSFDTVGEVNVAHGSVSYNPQSGMFSYTGQDVDILTILYNVMDAIPLVRRFLIRDDDPSFLYPAVMWNIRSNIRYTGEPTDIVNGYDGYTFDYFIEPVLTYRSRTTIPDTRNVRAQSANQQQRATNMNTFGMIVRIYDFFFTADNTEVIDLEFRLKNYYQEPYPGSIHTLPKQGQQGANIPWDTLSADNQRAQVDSATITNLTTPPTSQGLPYVLGQPVNPQSANDFLATSAYKLQGMVRQPYAMQSKGNTLSEAQQEMGLYQYSKQQYFRFDMIDVNMTVRFDPAWLLNPYCATGDFTPRLPVNETTDATLYLHRDRIVLLRANPPIQSDFMNPSRDSGSSAGLDTLSGFYQVITVVNDFDGGKFVQKLNMFKYPHLNGYSTLAPTPDASVQNASSQPAGPSGSPPAQQNQGSLAVDTTNTGGLMG